MKDSDSLNSNQPIVQDLSRKFHIPPLIISYLRSALLRPDNLYNKFSLIQHIIDENSERRDTIFHVRSKITEENVERSQREIQSIQKKIDFRQGVLSVLRNCDETTLQELLRPGY